MEVHMKAKEFFKEDYEKVLNAISGFTDEGKPAVDAGSRIHEPVSKAMVSVWDEGSIGLVSGYLKGKGDNITTRAWKDTVSIGPKNAAKFADKLVSNIEKCIVSTLQKLKKLED